MVKNYYRIRISQSGEFLSNHFEYIIELGGNSKTGGMFSPALLLRAGIFHAPENDNLLWQVW